jgi:hypothetical protein
VDPEVDSEDRIVEIEEIEAEIEAEAEVASKEEARTSRVRNPIWNASIAASSDI